ncbi:ParM/StbA family protein [Caproicibacter sp. BJN0012]|uniref:ParM/StbA family protein n=1 Tax=Caproicibacter sp. BJN0012 TaxID=3110227 RepID=UPI002E118507
MLISVDHGNKQIKTVHSKPFTSGLKESDTPLFGEDILRYQDKYYALSDQRIPYRCDKTEDERFFMLTLFAIAYEIEARGCYTNEVMRIQMAIGLPPAHYGSLYKTFIQYFSDRGVVKFEFRKRPYTIHIERVACFPQAYAAAVTVYQSLSNCPKAMILDIGGFTTDYLLMKNGGADLSSCDSLENGVIHLYNKIKSKVNAEIDMLLEESDIDAILKGAPGVYGPVVVKLVEQQAQIFINDLFSTLRERMLDLHSGKTVFVGGGAILLRRQIEKSGKVGTALFVEEINANAKGYELLYQIEQAGR